MNKSTRYVIVRVHILHAPDVNPDEVINECDYNFTHLDPGKSEIIDTEIVDVTTEYHA